MSEDEAINYLKEDIELYEDGCFILTDDDFKAIRIVLDLIEKQQKEIEQLKQDKNKLINYIAIREDIDFKDVVKKFDLGEEK